MKGGANSLKYIGFISTMLPGLDAESNHLRIETGEGQDQVSPIPFVRFSGLQ